jgi:hypothetical protein
MCKGVLCFYSMFNNSITLRNDTVNFHYQYTFCVPTRFFRNLTPSATL